MNSKEVFAHGVRHLYSIQTDGRFTQICWSPDGECLALGNDDGRCVLWSLSNQKSEWRDTGAFAGVRSVAWDTEGQRIGIGCVDGTIQIQYRNKPLRNTALDHGKTIREDYQNGIFEFENVLQFNTWGYQKVSSTVASIHWSTPLGLLLSSHRNGTLACWNSHNGEFLYERRNTGVCEFTNTNCVNPSGDLLAFHAYQIQVWNLRTWKKEIEIIQDRISWPPCMEWSRDGRFIAMPNKFGQIFVYDIQKGICIAEIPVGQDQLMSVSFSHDGSMLAATGSDQIIRIWRTEDWKAIVQLPDLDGPLSNGLAFHPKYNLLAVSAKKGQVIKVFELS